MPAFIAAAALSTGVTAVTGGAYLTAFGFAATAMTHFLVTTAIGGAIYALSPKPPSPIKGYEVTTSGSNLDHQVVYGMSKVSGVRVFDATNGGSNKYLHRVLAFTGHEIESFEEIYINDAKVLDFNTGEAYKYTVEYGADEGESFTQTIFYSNDSSYPDGESYYDTSSTPTGAEVAVDLGLPEGTLYVYILREDNSEETGNVRTVLDPDGTESNRYNGKLSLYLHYGAEDQLADSNLVSEGVGWTEDHKLSGISYIYAKMTFNQNTYANGVPEISAVVKGKKVYDPRTDTTYWSDNPALCTRDYLTAKFGLQESTSEIDDDSVSSAADICDQITSDGETRYTCNGAFTTGTTPYDILTNITTCMGGIIWYAQGKWRMKPAHWTEPVINFTLDDLRSGVSVQTRHSRRDNFNTINGTFRGPESDWQTTDFPPVDNGGVFLEADNNQESILDVDMPFTDNSLEARRLARIILERNRQQLTVSATFGIKAMQVQVGDNVTLTLPRFGWSNKAFEIVEWEFTADNNVNLTLREISESVFDEFDDGVRYERDNTTLLSPYVVPPVSILATPIKQIKYEKLLNSLQVTVSSDEEERIDYVEVEYRDSDSSDFISGGTGPLGIYIIEDLTVGEYTIRVRAVNSFGIKGDWNTLSNINADSLSEPPSDVTNFYAEVNGRSLVLTWDAVSDLDLSHYKIAHAIEESGSTWEDSTVAAEKVPRPAVSISLPARSGTYHIRAYDKGGIPSENYTSVVVPDAALTPSLNTTTLVDSPTFSGSKTGVSVVSSALRLTAPVTSGDTGTYEFSNYVDLGAVERAWVHISAAVTKLSDSTTTFDNLSGLVDTFAGNWDNLGGATSPILDHDVKFYVSYTEDDPSVSPTWSDWKQFKAGTYYGRAFKFKVELKSMQDDITPSITSLTAIMEYN